MTLFTIDTSHHDADRHGGPLDWAKIRAAGITAMCAKLTEGDPDGYDYTDPTGPASIRNARAAGFTLAGGYHCLSRGDAAGIGRQVDWFRSKLASAGANWAMLDVEPFAELKDRGIAPRFADVAAFASRWRAVDTRPLLIYLPRWYWSQLGSPSLAGLKIVASDYGANADGTYAALYGSRGGDTGRGWTAYGGVTPVLWQYTSNANMPGASSQTDVNAYRGTLAQLTLLLTGAPITELEDDMLTAAEHANLVATDERVRVALIEGRDEFDDDGLGKTRPWIVAAVKTLAADVAELKARPQAESAPVDAAALKAMLLDPEVVAAYAKAAADLVHADLAD